MKASELAHRSGVNPQTLRFYERKGLLADPRPRGVGYRDYADSDVRRVRFIKRAQSLGFTLKEIDGLLGLRVSDKTTCADVRSRAQAKLGDVEEKIAALESIRSGLRRLVRRCRGSGPVTECPILDALDDDPQQGDCES